MSRYTDKLEREMWSYLWNDECRDQDYKTLVDVWSERPTNYITPSKILELIEHSIHQVFGNHGSNHKKTEILLKIAKTGDLTDLIMIQTAMDLHGNI